MQERSTEAGLLSVLQLLSTVIINAALMCNTVPEVLPKSNSLRDKRALGSGLTFSTVR